MSYVSTRINEDLRNRLNEIGKTLMYILRQKAPKDTGALRRSLGYSITQTRDGYQLRIGYLYYGAFQDLGVRGTLGGPASASDSPFRFRTRRFGLEAKNWSARSPQDDEQLNADIQFLFGMDLEELFTTIISKTETMEQRRQEPA